MSSSPEVRLLYRDADLVAFDKPVGLLTIPGRKAGERCLRSEAERALGVRVWVVHRLDRETSGLTLFALTPQAHRSLNQAFERREIRKRYLALVSPPPLLSTGRLQQPIVAARRGFMRLAREGEKGLEAITVYRRLASADQRTLLEVSPESGRTHQIRLQLAELGSPIVGESHYRSSAGVRPQPSSRLWLHAWRAELSHPRSGEALLLEAAPPLELSP